MCDAKSFGSEIDEKRSQTRLEKSRSCRIREQSADLGLEQVAFGEILDGAPELGLVLGLRGEVLEQKKLEPLDLVLTGNEELEDDQKDLDEHVKYDALRYEGLGDLVQKALLFSDWRSGRLTHDVHVVDVEEEPTTGSSFV